MSFSAYEEITGHTAHKTGRVIDIHGQQTLVSCIDYFNLSLLNFDVNTQLLILFRNVKIFQRITYIVTVFPYMRGGLRVEYTEPLPNQPPPIQFLANWNMNF